MPRETISVGMTAALSGRYRLQGQQALVGVQAWVADTNRSGGFWLHERGRQLPLRLTYYDDASDAQQCGVLVERLITTDHVDILFGPYSSGLAWRAAAVAHRHEQVLWNHGGASEAIYTSGFAWVVGILSPPSTYFHSVIDWVRETVPSARCVAIVHSTAGAFPQDVAAGAERYGRARGFPTIHMYPYPARTTDFTPYLAHIAHHQPQLVLSVGRIEDDLRFATQYARSGLQAAAVGLIATPLALFRDTLGEAAVLFLGPSQWEPGVVVAPGYGPSAVEVLESLAAHSSLEIDYPMAQAYAGGLVVQRCVEVAQTLTPQALRQAANRLDVTTFYGRYRIDPASGRQVGHRMPVVQWQGGRKVVLWPRPMAE